MKKRKTGVSLDGRVSLLSKKKKRQIINGPVAINLRFVANYFLLNSTTTKNYSKLSRST